MDRIGVLSLAFFAGVWLQQAALTDHHGHQWRLPHLALRDLHADRDLHHVRVRPHPIVYLGAPLALLGIYLLTGADLSHLGTGEILLLIGSVCWAIQVADARPLVKETGLPVAISAINFSATAVLAMVGAFGLEHPAVQGVARWLDPAALPAAFSTGVAFTLQAIGQQYVPPANAAIILSSEALFAALGGALVLGERLPPIGYAGAAIIFTAIILVEAIPAFAAKRAISARGSA